MRRFLFVCLFPPEYIEEISEELLGKDEMAEKEREF